MKDIQAVIFDLDGTLVDTEGVAASVVQEFLEKHGISAAKRESESIVGRTWKDCATILAERFSFSQSIDSISKDLLERYEIKTSKGFKEVEGAVAAVKTLSKAYPLALVSGSTRSDIERALGALRIREYFQFYLGSEDYSEGKPSPEGFLKAMQKLGKKPAHVVIFEDSSAGIDAGRSAGAHVVAIECTNRYHQDQSKAHARIHDWKGMSPALLTQLIISKQ